MKAKRRNRRTIYEQIRVLPYHQSDKAAQLHALAKQAEADGGLFNVQKNDIAVAIGARFARLNAETEPNRKPRW